MEIRELRQATASQLLKKCSGIPQATLYRRLQKMLSDGILGVTQENHIRGTVEKVYALTRNLDTEWNKISETNDADTLMQFVTQYMLGILQEFKTYTAKQELDLKHDGMSLFTAPVYVSYEELVSALTKIGEIIGELKDNPPGGERKLHNFCTIVTPPKS